MNKPIPIALYGCGLCHNPPDYMCEDCKDTSEASDAGEQKRSINGCAVPADFIYV